MKDSEKIPERKCKVILSCVEQYIDEDKVKFIDIEEDFLGRDILTFECPKCGEIQKSFVLG